jgi:hypothetical protein
MNEVEITPSSEQGTKSVRFTSDYKRLLAGGWPAWQLMTEVVRLFTERAHADGTEKRTPEDVAPD